MVCITSSRVIEGSIVEANAFFGQIFVKIVRVVSCQNETDFLMGFGKNVQ